MDRYEQSCAALGVCLAANVPVVLWGPPGQGKTSVIQQLAADLDLHLETVIASIREPSDFAGLPVVDHASGSVALAPPRWARALASAERGVVFFDEMSTAPPAVQAAMLRVAVDRVVGDLPLPVATRVVAAANPPGVAADGWDLTPPLANRFCHLEWALPAATLRDGFAFGWPSVPVPAVHDLESFADAKRLVGVFLGSRPELVTRVPDSASEAGFAFPTPRSWEMAAKVYATATRAGVPGAVRTLLLSGCVGAPAAGEFLTYVASLDLPDPEELLADPDGLSIAGRRGDVVYAVAASVWAATDARLTSERWVACGRVLARIADGGHADIAYTTARRWVKARPANALPDVSSLRSLEPILRELGRFADLAPGL
ncbi:ATP-binding protein [Dactylosporangium sp. AC04546]|uniref:ATP-binding protein n=1 Tax=Dactylosporangium sp. AC04546 TaxID=2862460 RepID=UPI001EDCC092|nr:ATP-binding protein [Dactylosporangium sp. AC04546]WVK83533.1 ATP-binding protein [Dactylosporangium sp. AC04546]